MEIKWNEEVVDILSGLAELKRARVEGSEVVTETIHNWISEYFKCVNYEGTSILEYKKTSNAIIRITVLTEKIVINVDAFEDFIKFNRITNTQDVDTLLKFDLDTFKTEDNVILTKKIVFELLDQFTVEAIENYKTKRIYV